MMVFLMDQKFKRTKAFSDWRSFIWTDRFSDHGDFVLTLPYTAENAAILPGSYVEMTESKSVMLLESVQVKKDAEDAYVKLSGRSADILLKYIVFASGVGESYKGTHEHVAATLGIRARDYDTYKVTFGREYDAWPFYFGVGTQTTEEIIYTVDSSDLMSQIKKLLDVNGSGWRIEKRNNEAGKFMFRCDTLRDNDRVVLSTGADDFESFNIVKSLSNYVNSAIVRYVAFENGGKVTKHAAVKSLQKNTFNVLPEEVKNRSIFVDVGEDVIDLHGDLLSASLMSRGRTEIADMRYENAFDGELNPNMRYKYLRDYYLGDIVTIVTDTGSYKASITEYIWSSDNTGVTEYPTLSFM